MILNDRQKRALRFTSFNEDQTGKGLLTNHPNDRGGPTRWGITERLARKYKKNLISLTKADADEIMMAEFWKWDWVKPDEVAIRLFDIAVNSGPQVAAVTLQMALQAIGFELNVDGVVGPVTRKMTSMADPQTLEQAIIVERKKWLNRLIAKDPSQQVFRQGWHDRTEREIPA